MVKVIYGTKGTGKTKQMLALASEYIRSAKGCITYITDTQEYSLAIPHRIRYINSKDYLIASEDRFIGFLAGLIAGNTDTEYVFIDGAARICKSEIDSMEGFYAYLEKLCKEFGVRFIVTVSADRDKLPEFIGKHV